MSKFNVIEIREPFWIRMTSLHKRTKYNHKEDTNEKYKNEIHMNEKYANGSTRTEGVQVVYKTIEKNIE